MSAFGEKVGLLIFPERPSIGPIVLNCTTRERHGASYTMTHLPVEDGTLKTDMRIRNPIVLEIEGVLSPLPDTQQAQFAKADIDDNGQNRFPALDQFETAWARLRAYADNPEPSQVVTALEVYEDMLPVVFDHEEVGYDAIQFRMRLQQVEYARTRSSQFLDPKIANRGVGQDDLGQQGSRELTAQETANVKANFETGFASIGAAIGGST